MKNINIKPHNEKGNGHGYWEIYWTNGSPMYKYFFNDSKRIGYEEFNWFDVNNDKTKIVKSFYI